MDLESPVSLLIGACLAETALSRFDNAVTDKQIILVKDFSVDEVRCAIDYLLRQRGIAGVDPEQGPLLRIVPKQGLAFDGISDEILLSTTNSLTEFRNSKDQHRYVLFIFEDQTDAQSFGAVDTLRDRDLITGDGFSDGIRSLLSEAWAVAHPDRNLPESLAECCIGTLRYLNTGVFRIPLRKASKFLHAVAADYDLEGGLSIENNWVAVLSSLTALDLFGDIEAAKLDLSDGQKYARIKKNYFASEMMKPSGAELDGEQLAKKAEFTEFQNPVDGSDLTPSESSEWRDLCKQYCLTPSVETREPIPWGIFSQIFDTKTARKLGDRVRSDIEQEDPDELEAFDALDLTDGLNRGEADAAREFIAHIPDNPERTKLSDLLKPSTRRSVEKLADKAYAVSDVMPWLIEEMYGLDYREDEVVHFTVSSEFGSAGQNNRTESLFAFIYGRTLSEAVEATVGADIVFHVEDRLMNMRSITSKEIRQDLANRQDNQDEPVWPDLLLKVVVQSDRDGEPGKVLDSRVIKWDPPGAEGLRLFQMIASDSGLRDKALIRLTESSVESWYTSVTEGYTDPSGSFRDPKPSDILQSWLRLRGEFMDQLRAEGLSSGSCENYFLGWQRSVLAAARGEFILTGSPRQDFDDFCSIDIIDAGDTAAMLPMHPLRVRWIGEYLAEMCGKLIKVANGNLNLVTDNDGFFFKMLNRISPHQHPPYLVLPDNRVMKSTEEYGWSEFYKPLSVGTSARSEWISSLDEDSIDAIASECIRFVEFHPYKSGGIDVLVVQVTQSQFIEKLLDAIRKRSKGKQEICIRLHVVVPEQDSEKHVFFSEASADYVGVKHEGQLFPQIQLNIHPRKDSEALPDSIAPDSMDLAIVPNILAQNLQISPIGGAAESDTRAYHPLYSRPVRHIALDGDDVNVQVDLLPSNDDEALLDWASLSVMLYRSQPITEADSSAPAHMRLTINIATSIDMFKQLHGCALWVLTLDGYISRRHLEQLPNRPEVITFRENVGKNGSYNMVVSSNMGKQFVVPRVERKIASQFEELFRIGECRQIAEQLYDESCKLAPGIILRSLGGGWTLNELMGLVATKRLLDQTPAASSQERKLSVWIALDEYAEWFGGHSSGKRADLLRVELFDRGEDDALLKLTVIESKFGQPKLATQGVPQVRQSMGVVSEAFRPGSEMTDDGRQWRESLLHAIENSLSMTEHESAIPGMPVVPEEVRSIISNGQYQLAECAGCVVCHVPEGEGDTTEDDGRVRIIRTGRETITSLLRNVPGETLMPEALLEVTDQSFSDDEMDSETGADAAGHNETGSNVPQDETHISAPTVDAQPEGDPGLSSASSDEDFSTSFDTLSAADRAVKYDALMDRFAQLKVDMQPMGDISQCFIEGPSVYRIQVKPASNTTIKKIRAVEEEIRACLKLAEEQQIRIFQDRGVVWIEVPKERKERIFITAQQLWRIYDRQARPKEGALEVPFAVDMSGRPISIDFSSSNSPHLLTAGTTGSGKSVFLETLIRGVENYYTPEDVQMYLIDPKGNELIDFEDLPHVPDDVESEPEDAANLLEKAVAEMQDRYKKFKAHKKEFGKASKSITEYNSRSEEQLPRWLIVLDEYTDLVSMPEDKKVIEGLLQRLCQKSRAAGIHVILATQKPLAEVIGSVVKSNLPAALAFKVGKSMDSKVILDDVGAEALAGFGDSLFKEGSGKVVRVQCAMVKK